MAWTANSNGLTDASGPDQKAAVLLTAADLPADTKFAYFGFSLATNASNPNREVVGHLDGGDITSDAGGLLLREVEQRTLSLGWFFCRNTRNTAIQNL